MPAPRRRPDLSIDIEASLYHPGGPIMKPHLRLPEPTSLDLRVPHRGEEDPSWWTCRYCGITEAGLNLTTEAEGRRCLAHEAICPKRPDGMNLTNTEIFAFQTTYAVALRRQMICLKSEAGHIERRIARSWWFELRLRRSLRRQLEGVLSRILDVYTIAEQIGLGVGWEQRGYPFPIDRTDDVKPI